MCGHDKEMQLVNRNLPETFYTSSINSKPPLLLRNRHPVPAVPDAAAPLGTPSAREPQGGNTCIVCLHPPGHTLIYIPVLHLHIAMEHSLAVHSHRNMLSRSQISCCVATTARTD